MEDKFYPLDVESDGNGVRLFCRLEDREKVYIDDSFEPYFWLIPKFELDTGEIEKISVGDSFVTRVEKHDMFILRKPVRALKIFVNDARAIIAFSRYLEGLGFGEAREADIPFVKKYIIDKELVFGGLYGREANDFNYTGGILKPKIISFDIETIGDEIVTIAFFGDNYKKVISAKKVGDVGYVESAKNEEKLLERFFEILEETDPDYLVGYFSDGFDLPHIKKRCEFYGVANKIIVKKSNAKIEGVIHLDIFKFIRNVIGDSLKSENLTLDNVAKELVGEGKETIDGDIFLNGDIKQLCSYNLKDAELTFRIFERLLPNINDLVRLVGQPVFDVCRMSFGNLVEWYLIKKIKKYKELCVNEPSFSEREQRRKKSYKGAFVFEPKPGLYEDVAFLDFKSLYPSIIIAKNICISTYKDGKFAKEQSGLIPELLKEVIIKRNEIKKICKGDPILEAQSYSLKILANAIYGYFGYFNARWYCIEAARAITFWGRRFITRTAKNAEEFGFKVIYGDTDSIALISAKKRLDKESILEFLQETNKNLPKFMELELQGVYERGLFVSKKASASGAKKKYALISSDGIVIKGFESVRGDWSGIAREVQKKVLELILRGDVEEAISYTRRTIKDINEKRIKIEKMVIETQLKKRLENYEAIGPHVAAARILKERGFDVQPGTRIGYVVCRSKGRIRDRIQIPQEAKDYDAGYYINNQVLKVVGRIFDAVGCDTMALTEGQRKLI